MWVFCLHDVCAPHTCSTRGGQKRPWDLLELVLQTVVSLCGYWELNPSLLEKQLVFLTVEQSFQPPKTQILKRGIQIKAFVIHLPVCVAGVECWPMDSAVWKNMKHCLKVRSLCLRLHQPVCWPMWFQWSPCAYWCLPAYQPLLGVKCIISL